MIIPFRKSTSIELNLFIVKFLYSRSDSRCSRACSIHHKSKINLVFGSVSQRLMIAGAKNPHYVRKILQVDQNAEFYTPDHT